MKQRKKLKAMERKRDTEERKRNKYKSNNQITCDKMEITFINGHQNSLWEKSLENQILEKKHIQT